jgi:hypothetical protein
LVLDLGAKRSDLRADCPHLARIVIARGIDQAAHSSAAEHASIPSVSLSHARNIGIDVNAASGVGEHAHVGLNLFRERGAGNFQECAGVLAGALPVLKAKRSCRRPVRLRQPRWCE